MSNESLTSKELVLQATIVDDMSRFIVVELPAPATPSERKRIAERIASAFAPEAPKLPDMYLAGDLEPGDDVYLVDEVHELSLSQRRAWQDSLERSSVETNCTGCGSTPCVCDAIIGPQRTPVEPKAGYVSKDREWNPNWAEPDVEGCLHSLDGIAAGTEKADHYNVQMLATVALNEIDRLRAALPPSEVQRDADRYRALRKGNDYEREGPMVVLCERSHIESDDRPFWVIVDELLDQKIDADITAVTKEEAR